LRGRLPATRRYGFAALRGEHRSEAMVLRGRETATQYSYAAFRRAWIEELSQALRIEPRT